MDLISFLTFPSLSGLKSMSLGAHKHKLSFQVAFFRLLGVRGLELATTQYAEPHYHVRWPTKNLIPVLKLIYSPASSFILLLTPIMTTLYSQLSLFQFFSHRMKHLPYGLNKINFLTDLLVTRQSEEFISICFSQKVYTEDVPYDD